MLSKTRFCVFSICKHFVRLGSISQPFGIEPINVIAGPVQSYVTNIFDIHIRNDL